MANGDNATHGDNRKFVSRFGMSRSDYVDVEALQRCQLNLSVAMKL